MTDARPLSPIETLFVACAQERLPVGNARVSRNPYGILEYQWQSPCSELDHLSVFIRDSEIILSTQITHIHIDHCDVRRELKLDKANDHDLVEKSMVTIASILAGEIAFSQSNDTDGRTHSSGMGPMPTLADDIQENREIFGDGITTRMWNWFGEVTPEVGAR